jgi:hypothetical protein
MDMDKLRCVYCGKEFDRFCVPEKLAKQATCEDCHRLRETGMSMESRRPLKSNIQRKSFIRLWLVASVGMTLFRFNGGNPGGLMVDFALGLIFGAIIAAVQVATLDKIFSALTGQWY